MISIHEILQAKNSQLLNKIFEIKNDGNKTFVQIKLTRMNISNQERFMIQMVDISDTILYQQQKTQNE